MMQNYSYKVKNILKRHKNHTRYIIVFFLLSAFVVSFVCSALMKPAVSMTNNDYLDENAYESEDLSNISFDMEDNPTLLSNESGSLPKYGKSYTVENFLTDYLYVARGNLSTNTHDVGGFIVGGTASLQGGLQGAAADCYAGYLEKILNVSIGDWMKADPTYLGNNTLDSDYSGIKIYYGDISSAAYSHVNNINKGDHLIKNPEFINVEEAFVQIESWSNDKKNNGYSVGATNVSGDIVNINIDSITQKNIIIPPEYADKKVNFITNDSNPAEKIGRSGYTVTFSGVSTYTLDMNTNILVNDYLAKDTFFEGLGGTNDSQLNTVGLNFIWNFPDATSVEAIGLGGHIVAPKADIRVHSTNFEGSIIGNNLKIENEGHFYPYGNLTSGNNRSITVNKIWQGANSPVSASVILYKSHTKGSDVSSLSDKIRVNENETINLNPSNNWTYTWSELPSKDDDGVWYYYIEEINFDSGDSETNGNFITEYEGNGLKDTGTITIKNMSTGSITVKKSWSGITPYSATIKYKLYKSTSPTLSESEITTSATVVSYDYNGQNTDTVTLYNSPYDYTWDDLPLKNENEENLYYYVVESYCAVNGKSGACLPIYLFNGKQNGVIKVTNTENEKLNFNVKKIWEDEAENHEEVKLKLFSSTDIMSYSTDLNVNLTINIVEVEQNNPTNEYGIVESKTFTFPKNISTKIPLKMSKNGTVNSFHITKLKINDVEESYDLNGSDSAIVREGNDIAFNVPSLSADTTYTLYVKRIISGGIIQNEYTFDESGIKPILYNEAKPSNSNELKEIILNTDNNWTWSSSGEEYKAYNENGERLYYYIEEISPKGYTTYYSGNGLNQSGAELVVYNGALSDKMSLTVNKEWNPSAATRSESIEFTLYKTTDKNKTSNFTDAEKVTVDKDGASITNPITLNENVNWTTTIENLPIKDENDSLIYYHVVENNVDGYTVSYSKNGANTSDSTITIINTKVTEKTNITINKTWVDQNDKSMSAPNNVTEITFDLYSSITRIENNSLPSDASLVEGKSGLKITSANNWSCTINDLPMKNDNDQLLYYYVVETSSLSDYNVLYKNNGANSGTIEIINKYAPNIQNISLNLTKNWSDPDTQHNDITVEIHRSTNPNDVPKQTFITVTSTSMSASATSTTILTTTTAPTTKTYVFNNLPQNNKPTNGGDYIASVSNSFKYKLNSSDSYTNGTISSDGSSTISNVPADNSYIKYQVGAVYKLDLTRIKSGDTVTFKFNSDNKDNTNFGYYSNKSGGFVGFTKSSDNTYSVKITDDISHYEFQCWSNELEITDTSSLSFTANGMSSLIEVSVTAASTTTSTSATTSTSISTTSIITTTTTNAPSGNVVSGTITDYSSSPVIELAQTQIRKAKFTFSGNEWAEAKIKIKKSTNETKKIKLGFFSNNNSNICIEDDRTETDADWSNWVEENSYSISGKQRVFKDNSITFTFNDAVDSIQIEISNTNQKFTSIEYVVSDDSTAQFKSAFKISGLNLLASNQGSNSNTDATLVQEVTLGSNNSWTKTISDLPMYDESGNVYYYWVEEKFVNGYQSSYQYGDSPGDTGYITGNNGNITILNTKVTSGSIEMPSTGGKGINDYRNAGIIMMTASAGIYIALKILKKKSMEFK